MWIIDVHRNVSLAGVIYGPVYPAKQHLRSNLIFTVGKGILSLSSRCRSPFVFAESILNHPEMRHVLIILPETTAASSLQLLSDCSCASKAYILYLLLLIGKLIQFSMIRGSVSLRLFRISLSKTTVDQTGVQLLKFVNFFWADIALKIVSVINNTDQFICNRPDILPFKNRKQNTCRWHRLSI